MRLLLKSLTPEERRVEFPIEINKIKPYLGGREDLELVGPFAGEAWVYKMNATVHLKGVIRGTVKATCGRCLDMFEADVAIRFNQTLRPPESKEAGEEEDLTTGFHDGYAIQVDDIVAAQIGLKIPQVFLCDDECLGLCPSCGKNLNEGPCECSPQAK